MLGVMETSNFDDADIVACVRSLLRAGQPADTLARHWATTYASTPHICRSGTAACTQVSYVVGCKRRLLALLQSDDAELGDAVVEVARHAAAQLQAMWRSVKYAHRLRAARRPYRDEACGDPPFRDHAHGALHVRELAAESRPARSGRIYRAAEVEPFIESACRKRTRAALYRDRLEPRRLRACDMWFANEHALVGQWGLFARTALRAGTCIGVYGGQLLDAQDLLLLDDDRYLITASVETDDAARVSINGETLLSLANTLMVLDAQGRFAAHPDEGYNLEVAKFPASFTHAWQACVPALFATRDIAPGEELRWCYGLTPLRHDGAATAHPTEPAPDAPAPATMEATAA